MVWLPYRMLMETVTNLPYTENMYLATPIIDGPLDVPHDELIINRTEFLQFGQEVSLHLRSIYYDYLRTRFHIHQRNIEHRVTARFDGKPPEFVPLRFIYHPEDTSYSWQPGEVEGLVVASVLESFEPILDTYRAAEGPKDRGRLIRRQVGYTIGPLGLRHIVEAAQFFSSQAFRRVSSEET